MNRRRRSSVDAGRALTTRWLRIRGVKSRIMLGSRWRDVARILSA